MRHLGALEAEKNSLKSRNLRVHHGGMKTFLPWFPTVRVAFTVSLLALAAAATPARAAAGVPQPKQYAALLAKARAGTLEVIHGEPATTPKLFALKARAKGLSTSENF